MAWIKSKFPGVRFREHPTRKHGVRPDRYFSIRYKISSKDKEEALGWWSEGWTEAKAAARLAELKEARRTGKGAFTLAEARAKAEAERQAEREAEAQERRENITFGEVWASYYPQALVDKPVYAPKEERLYRLWLAPKLAAKPMRVIAPLDVERIKKAMLDAKRSPQTVVHALAVVRLVFNYARRHGLFSGDHPCLAVNKPKRDSRRERFFSVEEAERLLAALALRSQDVHDQALLSLDAGLRFSEAANLQWSDIDLTHGLVSVRDSKNKTNRRVPLTTRLVEMLQTRRGQSGGRGYLFAKQGHEPPSQVSSTFKRTVEELGFNEGVTDRRQKVVFHTFRHTCASWLVMGGTPLLTVGRLLGHSTTAMTERYAHLAPAHMRDTVKVLEHFRQEAERKAKAMNGSGQGEESGLVDLFPKIST